MEHWKVYLRNMLFIQKEDEYSILNSKVNHEDSKKNKLFNSINLLIKADLDISLNFNNGKSISNERYNYCKHLKRVKKMI